MRWLIAARSSRPRLVTSQASSYTGIAAKLSIPPTSDTNPTAGRFAPVRGWYVEHNHRRLDRRRSRDRVFRTSQPANRGRRPERRPRCRDSAARRRRRRIDMARVRGPASFSAYWTYPLDRRAWVGRHFWQARACQPPRLGDGPGDRLPRRGTASDPRRRILPIVEDRRCSAEQAPTIVAAALRVQVWHRGAVVKGSNHRRHTRGHAGPPLTGRPLPRIGAATVGRPFRLRKGAHPVRAARRPTTTLH